MEATRKRKSLLVVFQNIQHKFTTLERSGGEDLTFLLVGLWGLKTKSTKKSTVVEQIT